MSKLQELRTKYGFSGGSYEPNPDCKFCRGTGEKPLKHRRGYVFCICLFVDHKFSDIAGDTLGATATKIKNASQLSGADT